MWSFVQFSLAIHHFGHNARRAENVGEIFLQQIVLFH